MKIQLKPQESIRGLHRQSRWLLLWPSLVLTASILIPVYLWFENRLPSGVGFLWFGAMVVAFMWWLRAFTLHSVNAYIITTERLMVVIHEGFFQKKVYETPLDRILNISFKINGLTATLLGYGDVEVQVIGLMEPMVLRNVSKPSRMKDLLWKVHLATTPSKSTAALEAVALQKQIGYTKPDQKIL